MKLAPCSFGMSLNAGSAVRADVVPDAFGWVPTGGSLGPGGDRPATDRAVSQARKAFQDSSMRTDWPAVNAHMHASSE